MDGENVKFTLKLRGKFSTSAFPTGIDNTSMMKSATIMSVDQCHIACPSDFLSSTPQEINISLIGCGARNFPEDYY